MIDSLPVAVAILLVGGVILLTAGIKFTRTVDVLADRTGIGEALAGAVLLGAATSLPGLITTITGALEGEASFAVSNAIGGIAAQTSFLVIADLIYRRTNLEHAAASLPNLLQTAILIALVGIVLMAATGPEFSILGVHPASLALVVVYVYGLGLVRGSGKSPMWRPRDTMDTEVDEIDDDDDDPNSTTTLWIEFAGLAAVVAVVGYLIGQAGLTVASESGLSGSIVGALFTSVITSLPELVTVLTAVRIGPWKSHMQVREGFFDYLRPSAKGFNLRMDPFERHDGHQADLFAMQMGFAWGGQVRDLMASYFATFEACPPRQAGGSLRVELPQ